MNLPTGSNVIIKQIVTMNKRKKTDKPTRYQVLPVNYNPGPNLISPREYEVLQLLLAGKSGKQLASELKIAEKTVKFHKTRLFIKYKVKNVTQLFGKLLEEKDLEIKKLKQDCSDFADIITKDSTDRIVRARSNK